MSHGNAALGARLDVHVGADPTRLGNQFQARQLFQQLPIQVRSFSNQNHNIGIFEPHRQLPQPFDGVGVHLGGVGVQFGCAFEFSNDVLVVVKDHNIHGLYCALTLRP